MMRDRSQQHMGARVFRRRQRKQRRSGAVAAAVALAVIAAALAVPEVGPAGAQPAPDPTLSYTPESDLVDGQVIEVSGAGFTPDDDVLVAACETGVERVFDCDLDQWRSEIVEGDGSFTMLFEVVGLLPVFRPDGGSGLDCRTPGACELIAAVFDVDSFDIRIVQRTPLLLDSVAPLLPPPALTVDPAAGLIDGQQVAVSGTGFRQGEVSLVQCVVEGENLAAVDHCTTLGYHGISDGGFDAIVSVRARLRGFHPETGEPMLYDCRMPETRCVLAVDWGGRAEPVVLHFDPDGALQPPPAMEVDPASGLADGDELTISGSGFGAGGYLRVALCEAPAEGMGETDDPYLLACDSSTETSADVQVDGSFSASISAHGEFDDIWQDPPRSVDCRQAPGCAVVVVDHSLQTWVSAPISFGPAPAPRGRYLDPVFADVDITHDVHYLSTTDHLGRPVDLRMDIYEPAGDTARERPAIMWMHGGWFIFGDKADMAPYARESARRGYVGISLQYRLRPEITSSDLAGVVAAAYDAYDDSTAAVSWLKENADTYRIDPEAIMAGGYSAGGVNSFHLAFMPGQRGPAEPLIAAALPIAGIPFVGPEPGDPPVIGFHATDDSTVPASVGRERCAEAPAVEVVCEWVEYPSGGHGIVIDRFRDIVRRGHDFVTAQVLDPLGYTETTADAGGTYEVIEGSTVTLRGSISRGASDGSWAPGDRLDDPVSLSPVFTGFDDGTTSVTLTARDHFGAEASDVATVVTRNAPPVVESATATVASRRTIKVRAAISDPGLADTHEAKVTWGDGTVTQANVVQGEGSAAIEASHTPARSGTYKVTLRVTDDDGGSIVWQQSVKVSGSGFVSVVLEPIRQVVVQVVTALSRLLWLFR